MPPLSSLEPTHASTKSWNGLEWSGKARHGFERAILRNSNHASMAAAGSSPDLLTETQFEL